MARSQASARIGIVCQAYCRFSIVQVKPVGNKSQTNGIDIMTANAALNVVPTPRAWSGELAHPGLGPAGAE